MEDGSRRDPDEWSFLEEASMQDWSRRDVLKSGLLAAGAMVVPGVDIGIPGGSATIASTHGIGTSGATGESVAASVRDRLLLDFDWRFHLGHASDPTRDFGFGRGNSGAFAKTGRFFEPARPDFDATDWHAVDLPHDWAVELPFVDDRALDSHGYHPLGGSYPETSIGWYRKVFTVPASDSGRRISLEFDGVYRNAIVTLNDVYLTTALSGYAPFRVDVTDFVSYGGDNVLVLRVDATENEGWFYEGAGVYRHVWLVKAAPVHVPQWGTYVTTEMSGKDARVRMRTTVANESADEAACRVVSRIVDAAGTVRATVASETLRVPAWGRRDVDQEATLTNADLWSPDAPHLYHLLTTIESGGKAVDDYRTTFGVRTIHFDAERGFFLNGEHVELKGTCNHQDHAGVGSALPDRLQYYRIAKLKEMGSNAYRTSHNPPTPELLDACDHLGMLVLDETRMFSSSPEGLSQLERMILRDRNHPSVFCWSIGNEEPLQGTEEGARIASTMKRLARRLDPSRPITEAMNNSRSWGHGLSAVVDVQGFNYYTDGIDGFHARFPDKPSMGTEVASTVSTRGIYANDPKRGYVEAYDTQKPRWGATAEEWWTAYVARPFLAGGFVWTGFDYRGEPTPYEWPCINSHFGLMDTCGFPKDNYFYYKTWWGGERVLHLFPHWNWAGREGQEIDVWVYSNVERVELLLNGRSLGAKDVEPNGHLAWKVPYQPGTLEARGFAGGRQVLTAKRETTGPAARIELVPDRSELDADGEDVSVVEVRIVDNQGRLVPVADDEVTFEVSGAGRLIGVGNGDPSDHTSDKGTVRRAFNGLCVAIVQAGKTPGELRVEAGSPGLGSTTAVVTCRQVTPRPSA